MCAMWYKRMSIAGTTIWSPLASGVLSGKYSKGNVPADSRLALEAYKVLLPLLGRFLIPAYLSCIKHDLYVYRKT